MKFKFRLGTLLKHRGRLKDDAIIVFREAQYEADQKQKEIENLFNEIDKSRKWISEKEKVGDIKGISQASNYIKYVKIDIERKKIEQRELNMIVEEKKELLVNASREEKVLEKLKSKKQEEFRIESNRREQKKIDDLISMRHGRKV